MKADARENQNEETALHFAAKNGFTEILNLLLKNYPNLDLINLYGMTAYDWAEKLETRKLSAI